MANSVKKNFLYNICLTLSTYIINLLVFPYVSRVLGVEIVGKIGFVNNVITYFSLFAIWGVMTVGVREIAACSEDREKRDQVFSSIITILLITTVFVTTTYLCAIFFIPRFYQLKELFILGTFTLFFTSFLLEWLYQGLEEFRFITIRTVAVRLIYALCIFMFVRSADDYVTYFFMTVIVVLINSFINILYSRRFVKFKIKNVQIKRFLIPLISLGSYKIMTSMYTSFNVIFLGMVCSDVTVGNYYTSTKILYIILGVLTAFTTVMMPRMSSLLSNDRIEDFHRSINKSLVLIMTVALPMVVYGVVLAPQIIRLISGPGYENSIVPMRIVMPIILFSGIAQVWVIQLLVPMKRDNIILYASIAGAVTAVCANICFVERYGAIGSAIVLLIAEIVSDGVVAYYILSKKIIKIPFKQFFRTILSSSIYVIIAEGAALINNYLLSLLVAFVLFGVYFLIINRTFIKSLYNKKLS